MHVGGFLQTRVSKVFNVAIDQKTVPFKHPVQFFKYSAELLKPYDKMECSVENLKSSAACLCNNTVLVIPISQGNFESQTEVSIDKKY